jgi:hypothetical protein
MKVSLLIVVLAGCGAELGNAQPLQPDAPTSGQIDARPCTGGDASAVDPSTNSCLVYFAGPLPYNDASNACAMIDAKLAVVKSAETNAYVASIIGTTDAFLDADDRDTEGQFRWRGEPNDPLSAGFINWRIGEPNNSGGAGFQEDCVIIAGADGGWDDRPCDGTERPDLGSYSYVCQF